MQPRLPQRHTARQAGFEPGNVALFLLVVLLFFLVAKFPVVTLIVLGVLLLVALGFVLFMSTGHWAFG